MTVMTVWRSMIGLLATAVMAVAQDPFTATAVETAESGERVLAVTIAIPPLHYLYADAVAISAGDLALEPVAPPQPRRKYDPFSESERDIFDQDTTWRYALPDSAPLTYDVRVAYLGCNDRICFLPTEAILSVGTPAPDVPSTAAAANPAAGKAESWQDLVVGYRVAGTAAGYLEPEALIAFLEAAQRGEVREDRLQQALDTQGMWLVALLILVGGLALNLTPCVLPMIPVNIAIIGAGSQAGSRARGFALGGLYGLGIALAYGALGLVVIFTGTTFGALNASPWFNFGIAALFLVLALAMFNVFSIDLTRFQSGAPGAARKGSFLTAFAMGGVAALLAGACVAPVVISVLLLAANLYADGQPVGLLLPFLLGLGMALPWPLAGAGMSFLPKPGRWMDRVKIAFGVIILITALWYGNAGLRAWRQRSSVPEAAEQDESGAWLTSIEAALEAGWVSQKPVFLDFWATWCKNCLLMDKTTFKDPAVLEMLDGFVKAKVQAENPADPDTKAMLEHFGAMGLPTYVVLQPGATP